jgi:hypothetical protein
MTQLFFEPPVTAASVAWEHRGKLRATVVLKVSFAMASNGPLEPIPAEPLRPDELAFTLGAAEVIAHGAAGGGTPQMTLLSQGQTLIEKTGEAETSFGALPPTHPARARHAAGVDPAALERACEQGELVRLPASFERAYFQRAPSDQRVAKLEGGEMLLLKSLHPQFAEVALKIPRATVTARGDLGGTVVPVDMSLDTVEVDTRQNICTLLWRGRLAANRPESLTSTRVQLSLDVLESGFSSMHGAAAAGVDAQGFDATVVLPDSDESAQQVGDPLMGTVSMEDGPPPSSALATPFDQSTEAKPPPPPAASDFQAMLAGGTVTLTPEAVAAELAAAAIPFERSGAGKGKPAPAKPPPVEPPPVAAPSVPEPPVSVHTIDPDTWADPVEDAARESEPSKPESVASAPSQSDSPGPESLPSQPESVEPEPVPEPPAPEKAAPEKPAPEKVVYDPAAPRTDSPPAPEPPARKRPDIRASLYKKSH